MADTCETFITATACDCVGSYCKHGNDIGHVKSIGGNKISRSCIGMIKVTISNLNTTEFTVLKKSLWTYFVCLVNILILP